MITVVGAGAIGATIAEYLSRGNEVAVIDMDPARVGSIGGVVGLTGTIEQHPTILDRSDAVVVALPGSVSSSVVNRLIRDGRKVVDISFSEDDPMLLDGIARDAGALLIPDAGFAPGLSNILSGALHKEGRYSGIEIYVAGLPQERRPPVDYAVTWSVEGLIDEYTRPARIIRNGEEVGIDPLDDISCFHVEGLGDFEAFYSDGLRTLLATLPGVDMFEKTLRYPGHLSKIKFLRDMGYFSDTEVSGTTARMVSEKLFEKLRTGEPDVCVLIVRGTGRENREFFCVDRYDAESGTSSMARMTGYAAGAIAEAVAEGAIKGIGVLPPEKIGYDDEAFAFIRARLDKVGIKF